MTDFQSDNLFNEKECPVASHCTGNVNLIRIVLETDNLMYILHTQCLCCISCQCC